MSSTKYLIGGGVVIAALALTPLYISSRVDAKLDETKRFLEGHGFKQEMLSKSGYVNGTRTFTLEIDDAAKVRDFILDTLVAKNPQYAILAQGLTQEDDADMREVLNGLSFKGEVLCSHLLPGDVTVSLALSKLPRSAQEELSQNPDIAKVLNPIVDKGALAFTMIFGSDERLKSFAMKDIKEELAMKEGTVQIDTSGNALTLHERAGVMQGVLGIQKQLFGVNASDLTLQSRLENLRYTFDYKDDLNNKGDFSLGSYLLSVKEPYSTFNMSLGGMKIMSSAEESNKQWNAKAEYALNGLNAASNAESVSLETLNATLALKGVDAATIKKLQNDYNRLMLAPQGGGEQALVGDVSELIRHGLKLDFNVGLKNMRGVLALKDVTLTSTLQISQNDFDANSNPLSAVTLLDVSAKFKLHKDDRTTLEALNLTAPSDFALGKAEGDFFVYDIAFKKGVLSVNDQAIQ